MKKVSQQSDLMQRFGGILRWIKVGKGHGRQSLSLEDTATSMKMRNYVICHFIPNVYSLS